MALGVEPDRIVFANPCKRPNDIKCVAQALMPVGSLVKCAYTPCAADLLLLPTWSQLTMLHIRQDTVVVCRLVGVLYLQGRVRSQRQADHVRHGERAHQDQALGTKRLAAAAHPCRRQVRALVSLACLPRWYGVCLVHTIVLGT